MKDDRSGTPVCRCGHHLAGSGPRAHPGLGWGSRGRPHGHEPATPKQPILLL